MRFRLLNIWDGLRGSFWFIPSLMAFFATVTAMVMIRLDMEINWLDLRGFGWVFSGSPEGARSVLSSVATTIMTVAGVTFSITIAALSLASQQFGPRLLGNFMRDRSNQAVLGTFISTFIYCLLVLRTVRSLQDEEFVPHLAVTLGIIFTLVSIGVLIFFIHHIADSIQVSTIIHQVGGGLDQVIDRLYPTKVGEGQKDQPAAKGKEDLPDVPEEEWTPLPSAATGYIRSIDTDQLLCLAQENELIFRLLHHPGEYVIEGSSLVEAWPGETLDCQLIERANSLFTLGHERSMHQDLIFAVHQLVEVAVRALSPGVNDPFTAITCIDRLSAALCRLAGREKPSPYRYDEEGRLRLIIHPRSFDDMADAAFHQIRQYGSGSVSVIFRMLEMIAVVARHTQTSEDRDTLRRHAGLIKDSSMETIKVEADRGHVMKKYQEALLVLSEMEMNSESSTPTLAASSGPG